ncbi:hypothetical protein C823_001586 [Eubacterium plexicaudatum ASF492]|nr:hypothetical protein C823_001586 [Eubacterium plexicaudatum ASF492]
MQKIGTRLRSLTKDEVHVTKNNYKSFEKQKTIVLQITKDSIVFYKRMFKQQMIKIPTVENTDDGFIFFYKR